MKYELDGRFFEINTDEEVRSPLTSLHALMRVMQRRELNEQQSLRMIENAWNKGSQIADLPTRRQRQFVENHMKLLPNGWTQMRVYQDFLFIFAPTDKLITAYPLPKGFFKTPLFDQNKQRVRNFKKYCRMNPAAVPA